MVSRWPFINCWLIHKQLSERTMEPSQPDPQLALIVEEQEREIQDWDISDFTVEYL